MRTLSQKMLRHAYEKVSGRRNEDAGARKKYGIWCHNLPGLVQQCGLAQSVAFLESKKGDGADKAFGWLLSDLRTTPGLLSGEKSLLELVRDCEVMDYIRYSGRIQEALVFFKRFAISLLDVKSGDEEEADSV